MIKAMMIKAIRNKIYVIGALVVTASVQADAIPEIDCLIEPNMVIELSSPVSGVLDSISVDRSDAVNQGQIVATLKSDVEQVKLRASQETLNLSKVEQKRSTELYRDSAITLSEKEQSDHEVAISELEVESARANLELRNIRSPIDGVVADRYLMPGEFIEDKPLLKIAQLDPLRVEVVAPVTYFGRVRTGMHAQVKTEFGSFDNLVAEVVVVDKVIDAASGTFGIRLELKNKDYQIPGGLKCSVRFFDEQEEAEYANLHTDGNSTGPVELPAVTEQNSVDDSQHSICRRIGPFRKKDKVQALMAALENDISTYQIQEETSTYTSYRVITEPPGSREAAKQIETEMKQAGVKDIA
ncbi:MAG: efflux RND transporter periplasmic adaptor subunit, partial [Gammaproteobacteria bacterium]